MDSDIFYKKVSKKYVHIDFPLSKRESDIFQTKLDDPKNVLKHRFLPFIQFEIKFKKHPKLNQGIWVPKNKSRPISLASHHDSGVYAKYAAEINGAYNEFSRKQNFSSVSVAYRTSSDFKGVSNITVAKETFDFIDKQNEAWIIKGDFKGFFDNLNHNILHENVAKVLNIDDALRLEAWNKVLNSLEKFSVLKQSEIENKLEFLNQKFPVKHFNQKAYFNDLKSYGMFIKANKNMLLKNAKTGIPQGTSLSAVLANVYMIEFDDVISNLVNSLDGLYRRYSDDFIIVIPKGQNSLNLGQFHELADKVIELSSKLTKLKIESDKTKKISFKQGYFTDINTNKATALDYLGFIFADNTVSIRSKSIYKYYYRGRKAIKAANSAKEMYALAKKHPKWSTTKLYDFKNKAKFNISGSKVHPKKITADKNRIRRIKYHVTRGSGLPEVNSAYRGYLANPLKIKPRTSYLSYARLADNIFQRGNHGYNVVILKQANKLRYRLQKNKK